MRCRPSPRPPMAERLHPAGVSQAAVAGGGRGARARRGPGRRRTGSPRLPPLAAAGAAGQDPPPSILRPRGLAALLAGQQALAGAPGRDLSEHSPRSSGVADPFPSAPVHQSGLEGWRRRRQDPVRPLLAPPPPPNRRGHLKAAGED